jgi:UDP-N-acetylmuramate-alanine ligase
VQIHLLTPYSHHVTSIRLTMASIRQLWPNTWQLREEALIDIFISGCK